MTANVSLAVFVLVVAVNVFGLLLDGWLYRIDAATISQYVWSRPWWGLPIVVWQALGAVAIGVHFYARRG